MIIPMLQSINLDTLYSHKLPSLFIFAYLFQFLSIYFEIPNKVNTFSFWLHYSQILAIIQKSTPLVFRKFLLSFALQLFPLSLLYFLSPFVHRNFRGIF